MSQHRHLRSSVRCWGAASRRLNVLLPPAGAWLFSVVRGEDEPWPYLFFVMNRKGTLTHAATGFDASPSV
jgi:hypothetical protein